MMINTTVGDDEGDGDGSVGGGEGNSSFLNTGGDTEELYICFM